MKNTNTNPAQTKGRISLRTKLIAATVGLAVVALAATAFFNYRSSSKSLREEAFAKLQAVGNTKAESIEAYFQDTRFDLANIAESLTTKSALRELSQARSTLLSEMETNGYAITDATLEPIRAETRQYYQDVLIASLKKVRTTEPGKAESFMHPDAEANLLQYVYTAKNPADVGSKFQNGSLAEIAGFASLDPTLRDAFTKTTFARAHSAYHPSFNAIRERHGYYDMFLVDTNGFVVYTVFKELDFNGNLKTGPEKNTGLGQAFAAAWAVEKDNSLDGHVVLTDFAPYPKSYDAPASFIASPVYGDDAQKVGVLIVQLPIDKINAVMTSNNRQKETGLGESGETYLIGKDLVQRTDSRFLKDLTAGTQKRTTLSSDTKSLGETSIGTLKVDSFGARSIFAGSGETKGTSVYSDYRGVPVLGFYSPLKIKGANLGILAEIDGAEAFAAVQKQALTTVIVGAVSLVFVALVSLWVASQIARPVIALDRTMAKIAAGDENARAPILSKDEIGQMAETFNKMVTERNAVKDKIVQENKRLQGNIQDLLIVVSDASDGKLGVRAKVSEGALGNVADALNLMLENVGETIANAKKASEQVANAASEITNVAQQLEKGEQRQTQEIFTTSEGVRDLNGQAQSVLKNCQSATAAAENGRRAAEQGAKAVRDVIQGMEKIRENTQANAKKIKRLGDRSMEIAGIVKIIGDISAKTDMLALNASIEAARAGEQGRGFTVVAEQVRGLADRTKTLTNQIEKLVGDIQKETGEAVAQMETQTQEVEAGTKAAQSAGGTLDNIVTSNAESSELVSRINQAATKQASRAQEMIVNVNTINQVVAESAAQVRDTRSSSEQLMTLSSELNKRLAQFELEAVA